MVRFRVTIERASEITNVPEKIIRRYIKANDDKSIPDRLCINGKIEGDTGYVSTTSIQPTNEGPALVDNEGTNITKTYKELSRLDRLAF